MFENMSNFPRGRYRRGTSHRTAPFSFLFYFIYFEMTNDSQKMFNNIIDYKFNRLDFVQLVGVGVGSSAVSIIIRRPSSHFLLKF